MSFHFHQQSKGVPADFTAGSLEHANYIQMDYFVRVLQTPKTGLFSPGRVAVCVCKLDVAGATLLWAGC